MSNIAYPTRSEGSFGHEAALSPRLLAQIATGLATILLTVAIVSFRPYQVVDGDLPQSGGGDLVNQLGFGSLGVLAIVGLLTLADRRVLSALLSPWWMLLLFFVALSVMISPSPPDAMRAALFTLVGLIIMAAVVTLPRDAEAFSRMLVWAALTILAFCYFGVVALPEAAIHGAGGFEPQHEGLWRGSFSHKNNAAPVMAALAFAGLYLWRRHWRWSGACILVLALLFMAHTGSKTTFGTVPLAVLLVAGPSFLGLRLLTPFLVLTALAVAGLATLGIVFIEPLTALRDDLMPELTYTGRTTLWQFMGEMISERPWRGYGFGGFWGTDTVFLADHPFDRAWDIRGIVHGHNSYMDLIVTMGFPALAVALITFVLVPLRDFMRTPLLKENILLADFYMMIVCFTLLNAFLESYFFRRVDPVWLLLAMALLGLRLAARFPIPKSR